MFYSTLLAGSLLLPRAFSSPLSTSPFLSPHLRGASAPAPLAPVLTPETPHLINNSYIIMLKPGVDSTTIASHFAFLQLASQESQSEEDGLKHVYDGPQTKGYAGSFSSETVERIRMQPEVEFIEQDQTVWALDLETQKNAPWGLARVSHVPRLRFGTLTRYDFDNNGGEGVDAYVIDTGINIKHEEFEGRATWGKTMPANDVDEDGNGHGTHCAGTIASRRYGVAKKAQLIAVKVLGSNGSGSMSDVVGGVVWAATQASKKAALARQEIATKGYTAHKGSVANMSLGGGKSKALDDAVDAAVDGGMHFAVAAGNDNKDACNYSPAGAKKAVTVGASTVGDERAYFSNWGTCVDVFAPGLSILSTWTGSKTATNTISGTSMASPHTAGMLAYLLSIYPSISFDPKNSQSVESLFHSSLVDLGIENAGVTGVSGAWGFIQSILPSWLHVGQVQTPLVQDNQHVSGYDVAPIPGTLSPKHLKDALLALATKDALTDLPKGTPNLLIYNNVSALTGHY